jgi:hypothetical protein
MLRSFTVIDPHLVNLIRKNPRYTKMSPEEILGKFVSGCMMVPPCEPPRPGPFSLCGAADRLD